MKLNHMIPAMVFIFFVSGCGGKLKQSPTDQTAGTETPFEHDEKKTTSDPDGYNGPQTITNKVNFSSSGYATADSTSVYLDDQNNSRYNPLSSTGTTLGNDGVRKFIKTADLKFRVQSVIRATYDIEDITHRLGGFVAHTSLESKVDNVISTRVSRDSTLETTYYTVVNSMLIRVPETKMDSALRAMTPLVDYMDHRVIDVKDVHIQLIADQLAQTRLKNYQNRMKNNVDGKGRDLEDMNMAEENILSRQEEADNVMINNLNLQDQIEFATITINIYQRQAIKRELVFNSGNVDVYEPGLGYKIKRSFIMGWKVVEMVILFALRFWALFVIAIAVLIFWRWWSRR